MGNVRHLFLACSALAPIALTTPATAALDSGLRGAILQEDVDSPHAAHKQKSADIGINSLAFAAPRSDSASVTFLALASPSPSYNQTARQIATSMGFLGNTNGAGVIIGVVDTGVSLNHPEFLSATGTSRILPGTCLGGFSGTLCASPNNKIGGDDLAWPTITHGTHVAGIAAGLNVGVASGASILPVRVCDSATGSCPGDIDGGIVWASQHGANVINLSLGGSSLTFRDLLSARIAVSNGALLVVAAGNSGNVNPAGGFIAGAALYNGIRGSMIVVGALDATNHIASFSQTPGNTCLLQSGQTYCMQNYFVVAPGYSIVSSVGGGGYATLSGTSMATPYVSGVAALVKGLWPYLTMPQVAKVILGTAIDLGAPGPDPVYGMGEVDAATALQPAGTTSVVTGGTNIMSVPIANTSTASTSTGGSTATKPGGNGKSVKDIAMNGALSAGVSQSAFLKKIVAVDSYGRDYSVDLTKGVRNAGFDISSFVMLDSLLGASSAPGTVSSGLRVVSSAGYSPQLGLITLSGVVDTLTTPAVFASAAASRDSVRSTMSNLAFSASPSQGLTFDLGYKLRLAGRINAYDANSSAAYSGLYLSASAVNSPYASLTDGGNYVGTAVKLADGLNLRTGFSWLNSNGQRPMVPPSDQLARFAMRNQSASFDQRAANAAVMSLSWNFADWGGLGVVASQTGEHNGVLGGSGSGALNLARSASTSAIDASLRFALGKDWLATVSYGQGLTSLNIRPDGLLDSASALRSRSYGIAVATRDVLGDDSLGLALTRPMHIYSGSGTLTAATAVDEAGNLTISHGQIDFAPGTPETDLEVGYTKAFLQGRLSLQADAAYQLDVGGQSGRNAATFLTRLRLGL